ncbi:TPA: hypothetical protein HA361_00905 [Candidatus Woesearchaeota archaeon]|nr:hypothetical protein [Candidatus Woesearchaeota archaeon]
MNISDLSPQNGDARLLSSKIARLSLVAAILLLCCLAVFQAALILSGQAQGSSAAGEAKPIADSLLDGNGPLLSVVVMNLQSYPSVGGKWIVFINTTGTGDMRISAGNRTAWSNAATTEDLQFLSLSCGGTPLGYEWEAGTAVFANYSCSKIGAETSKVLTQGKHAIAFNFSGVLAYAFNNASVSSAGTLLRIWDDADSELIDAGAPVHFYANYSNSSDGVSINGSDIFCNISFTNATGAWTGFANMTYNATTAYYQHNITPSLANTSYYNVSCTDYTGNFTNLSAVDSFSVGWVNVSLSVGDSLVGASHNVSISGHINRSDGTNVTNAAFRVYIGASQYFVDASSGVLTTAGSGAPVTDGNGTFSYNLSAPSGSGVKAVVVNITADGLSGGDSGTFIVDDDGPFVTLEVPANSYNTTGAAIEFNWSIIENYHENATCNLTVNGVVNVSDVFSENASVTNVTVADFPQGSYSWNVFCNDTFGNTGSGTAQGFTVDQSGPNVTLNAPANNSWSAAMETSFNITAYDARDVESCWLFGNFSGNFAQNRSYDSITNNVSSLAPVNVSDGTYVWNAYCNDTLGNSAFSSSNYTVKVDTLAPNVTNATLLPEIVYTNSTAQLNVTVADDSPVGTVWIAGNWTGSWANYTVSDSIGQYYLYNVSVAYLDNQESVGWQAYANDSAGNVGNGSIESFFVNNLGPPGIPSPSSPLNSSGVTFDDILFSWSVPSDPDNDALTYQLLVANDSEFTQIAVNATRIPTNSYTTAGVVNLTRGTRYWKVNASDIANSSNYSIVYTLFVVEAKFNITNPLNGTIVYPGDTADVNITALRDPAWLSNMSLIVDGTSVNMTVPDSTVVNWTYAYTVPNTTPKVISIIASGFNITSDINLTKTVDLFLSKHDAASPSLNYLCGNVSYVLNGTTIVLTADYTLDTLLSGILMNVTTPSGQNSTLAEIESYQSNLTYSKNYTLPITETGTHTITSIITDIEGNSLTNMTTVVGLNASASEIPYLINATGVSSVAIKDVCSNTVYGSGTTSAEAAIRNGSRVDIAFTTAKPGITLSYVELLENTTLALNYTDINKGIAAPGGQRAILEFVLTSNLSFESATISYNYSAIESALDAESGMKMYKCASQSSCSWSELSAGLDTANNVITATTTGLSVFLISEAATTTTTVTTTTGGGGGGGGGGGSATVVERVTSIEMAPEGPLNFYPNETSVIRLAITNNGEALLNGISLYVSANDSSIITSIFPAYIEKLGVGENQIVDIMVLASEELGRYALKVTADTDIPRFSSSSNIFIDIVEKAFRNRTLIVTQLQFAQDLFKEHPECLEFQEVINEAERALYSGDLQKSQALLEAAIAACKEMIALSNKEQRSPLSGRGSLDMYIFIAEMIAVSMVIWWMASYYRKRRERRLYRM